MWSCSFKMKVDWLMDLFHLTFTLCKQGVSCYLWQWGLKNVWPRGHQDNLTVFWRPTVWMESHVSWPGSKLSYLIDLGQAAVRISFLWSRPWRWLTWERHAPCITTWGQQVGGCPLCSFHLFQKSMRTVFLTSYCISRPLLANEKWSDVGVSLFDN